MATTNGAVTTYYPEDFRDLAVKLCHGTPCPKCGMPMRYQGYKLLVSHAVRLQATAYCDRPHLDDPPELDGMISVYSSPTMTL